MVEKKAELKIAGEEPEELEEQDIEEEIEENKETERKKRGRPKKNEEETAEEFNITEILANHEDRIRIIESFIFRLKNL